MQEDPIFQQECFFVSTTMRFQFDSIRFSLTWYSFVRQKNSIGMVSVVGLNSFLSALYFLFVSYSFLGCSQTFVDFFCRNVNSSFHFLSGSNWTLTKKTAAHGRANRAHCATNIHSLCWRYFDHAVVHGFHFVAWTCAHTQKQKMCLWRYIRVNFKWIRIGKRLKTSNQMHASKIWTNNDSIASQSQTEITFWWIYNTQWFIIKIVCPWAVHGLLLHSNSNNKCNGFMDCFFSVWFCFVLWWGIQKLGLYYELEHQMRPQFWPNFGQRWSSQSLSEFNRKICSL